MLFENDSYPLCGAREKESERRGWLSHFSHDLIPAALSKDRTMQGGFFSFFFFFYYSPPQWAVLKMAWLCHW